MINIFIDKEPNTFFQIIEKDVYSICNNFFDSRNLKNINLNIIFADDTLVKNLKKEYFNQDVYTDVITFNFSKIKNVFDGEIYISLDRVRSNANEYQVNLSCELKRIIIHGLLHFIGFDDQTKEDKKNMTMLEDKYLSQYANIDLLAI
tara:strand:- start:122 stop:565 length:444 start_codon:yes stop_codon:yes gene_type:complete